MWGSNIIAYYWNILYCASARASFFSFWYQEPYFSPHRSLDVVTGPTACARFKAGFDSFWGGGGRSCKYFLRYFMCRALSLLSPLIGPADPPARYFLERIRRTVRFFPGAGLHRALERIKLVLFCAYLLMTPSPRPSRKVELKLKTRKVKRKVRVPSLEEGRPSTFLTIWVWVEITEGRKFLKLRLSHQFCYFVAWGPGFRELWYMRPH